MDKSPIEKKEGSRKRTRISGGLPAKAVPAIIDDLVFEKNQCSNFARKIAEDVHGISLNYWIDKHYHNRYYIGDADGKREGIEPGNVYALVMEAVKHLMFYSGVVKNFKFLNYKPNPADGRLLRVVCQKVIEGHKLNVIIECHAIKLDMFEITIITALQKEDFEISDGQYSIELLGAGNSTLFHCSRGKLVEISSI